MNENYGPGDAEYLYNMIRLYHPSQIIEIGSGYSTKMSLNAIRMNRRQDGKPCVMTCIEPYEQPWLTQEKAVTVIREPVENIELSLFSRLKENDILFIDSSHIIRPQGDVLYEYQRIIPCLQKGVLIHIHDIFTPYDYPREWVIDEIRMWNEQYLLEALLSFNRSEVEIIGMLHYLYRDYKAELVEKCPVLKEYDDRAPAALWLRKL